MISKVSIKRPVTTAMVLLIVLMAGFISLTGLKMDLMPNIDIPIAIVSTTYVGAGPEEIETLITKPLEESLGTVSNVDTISSTSSSNSSMILVQFQDGTDIDMAAVDMREKVDMVKGTLPDDANDPMVLKLDVASMSSIIVGVESSNLALDELNTLLDDSIINRIERIDGVASVTAIGGVENEVEIVVNTDKMQGYGITETQIANVLKAENMNLPSGNITQGTSKLLVRSIGEFKSIDEIRDLPLTSASGAILHLSDVAEVNEVEKDLETFALINGEPAMAMIIQKQSTANVVDVSDKVNREITRITRDYPNLEITMLSDTADYIKTSINNVVVTAFQAAVLAIFVLLVFLKDARMALIIGISIPTSIVSTFALMYLNGMTLNLISTGGLAIGIGMLVDNSVVVLENIYTYWRKGMDKKEAAAVGAQEVAMAVTASTLTTVAVFFPLMFIGGSMGDMFSDLSLTICFSLFASLVVSLTFVPMACSQILKNPDEQKVRKPNIFTKFLDLWGNGLEKLDAGYRVLLDWCLIHKKIVAVLVVAAFIGTMSLIPIIGIDLMPSMDQGSATIAIEMPKGTVLEETEKVVYTVLDKIEGIPEFEDVYVTVGGGMSMAGGGTDSASVMMNLVDLELRQRSTAEVCREVRQRLSDIAGCEITVSESASGMGSMGGSGVSVQLNGDDTKTLMEIGNDIQALIADVPGLYDITSSAEDTVAEANVVINRQKATKYGMTTGQLASAINTAITGSVAGQYKVDGDEIDIRIRHDKEAVKYVDDLKNLLITTPTGAVIPITEVAEIQMGDSALSITRKDQHKYITVSASMEGRDINSVKKDMQAKMDTYIFPDGYDYEFTGSLEDIGDSYSKLGLVFVVSLLLVYMIMASQFESFIHPFIVMFSIPLAISGGIFGLFVTGKTITVTAFMGFIMLLGMVVNNAIVLIDATNQIVAKGEKDAYHALIEAGPNRLRPILMTTLTTVLGMVPMSLALGEGMEMQQPMAISIIFGLSISTLVTLIFVPVLYLLVDKLRFRSLQKKLKKNKLNKQKPAEDSM